jgi:DNA polymerase III sliding clamp (beta) subunit (PCNA family)
MASKDPSRYNVCNVNLEQGDGSPVLVATNGHALAVLPVMADESEFGPITVAAIIHGRKVAKSSKLADTEFKTNGNYSFPDGSSLPLPDPSDVGEFPNWRQVIPDHGKNPVTLKLGLNPKLLFELAEAIDSPKGVILEFTDDMSPVRVTGSSAEAVGNFGVIMPMRT